MIAKTFIDSNVWVYLFLQDNHSKYLAAERYIEEESINGEPVISWQVVNEVTRVLYKNHFAEPLIRQIIENMCRICNVQDFSQNIALSASVLRAQYMLSFWDSHIVASALAAGCLYLASEDMQDRQKIEGQLIIINPFK